MAEKTVEEQPGGMIRTGISERALSKLISDGAGFDSRWPGIVVVGTAITVVGIAYASMAPLLGILIAAAGLVASGALQRAIAGKCDREGLAFDGVVAIGLDLLSLYLVMGAVGLSGLVLRESALFAMVAYTVVLLCSLIKSNALKASPIRKAIRIGSFARLGIGLVLLVAIAPEMHGFGLPVMARDFANIVTELLAAFALTASVHRAARVGSRFARRDPTPAGSAEGPVPVTAAA